MAGIKKKGKAPKSGSERAARHVAKKKSDGKVRLCVYVHAGIAKIIRENAKSRGCSQGQMFELLLRDLSLAPKRQMKPSRKM